MYNIAVLKGDGIGPDVVNESIKVINKVAQKFDIGFNFIEADIGGIAYDKTNDPLPQETIAVCKKSDAIILGAVGGPKWDNLPPEVRPEKGLLRIRKELELFANIRPAKLFDALKEACPLKDSVIGDGIDMVFVRELTGGIYFGERGRREKNGEVEAYDTDAYTVSEVKRITRVAYEFAMRRKKNLISIDKANVLENSRLWREIVESMSKEYPEVEQSNMLVDNAAMQLVKNPSQFDVVLANNIFGDILSDEAAQVTGSIGILASSSMGEGTRGLYEPIHGSAPDIAGKNIANPIASILSCAMMLRDSLSEHDAADAIEEAINKTLEDGYRTFDLLQGENNESFTKVSCSEMGDRIAERV